MKSQISPAVAVGLIVVIVAIVAAVGWNMFGAKPQASTMSSGGSSSARVPLGAGAPPLSPTGAPMSGGRYISGGPTSPGPR